MTTEPFPLESLSGFDAAALVGIYDLDQCNPNISIAGSRWFHDYEIIGAIGTLAYVDCEHHLAGSAVAAKPYTFVAGNATPLPALLYGTTALTVQTERDLQSQLFTSFNDLTRFELLECSSTPVSVCRTEVEWSLPGGASIVSSAAYTSLTTPDCSALCLHEEVLVRSGDMPIYRQTQTGPLLFEHLYHLTAWGCWTARTLVREREGLLSNSSSARRDRKRGPGLRSDPKWDAKVREAYADCGARSYSEGAGRLRARFPGLTEDVLRHAIDRDRHRPDPRRSHGRK